MPLKIELKPNESIIIGESLIKNDKERIRFYIDGSAPILREKYILLEKDANTPCKKIYFVVQQMYLSKEPKDLHEMYFKLIRDVFSAAPNLINHIMDINENILAGKYYAAIKNAVKLVEKEEELYGDVLSNEDSE
jgi:flagellar protein FlbT